YKLQVDPGSSDYIPNYYNGKADGETADLVAVTSPNLTGGINAVLQRGGQIAGQVTGPGGVPLDGARVYVYDANGNYLASAYTSDDGRYTTTPGIPAGSYHVYFVQPSNIPG